MPFAASISLEEDSIEFGYGPSSDSNEGGLLKPIDTESTENGWRSSCASPRCLKGDWSRNSNCGSATFDSANENTFAAGLGLEPWPFTTFRELGCPGCL